VPYSNLFTHQLSCQSIAAINPIDSHFKVAINAIDSITNSCSLQMPLGITHSHSRTLVSEHNKLMPVVHPPSMHASRLEHLLPRC